jgi:two-component system, NtrC family, sensor kinase
MTQLLENLQLSELQQKITALTAQLLQSEKLATIGQLAAGVAHEINNPIGYIASNMQVLSDYSKNLIDLVNELASILPDQSRKALFAKYDFDYLKDDVPLLVKQSEEGIGRVVGIISDLKDFSHIDEAEFTLADIHQGLQSTLNIVNNEIKYKAEVIKEFGVLPEIECMPAQLNQVFMNLLVNAAQAIDGKGTLRITTACEGNWVSIAIKDSGKGISTEQREKIFEPFYTTKPKGMGTGLGLSLSQTIIDKHGGRIELESQIDKGSCFSVWLPIRQTNQSKFDKCIKQKDVN